jgi:hypothetical protein
LATLADGAQTMDWTIRRVRPDEAEQVLQADVFDGPATGLATARFLGLPGAPDPRNILMVAERGGQIVGFASGTVLDLPTSPLPFSCKRSA